MPFLLSSLPPTPSPYWLGEEEAEEDEEEAPSSWLAVVGEMARMVGVARKRMAWWPEEEEEEEGASSHTNKTRGKRRGDNLTVPRGGWNEKSESGERNSSEMMQMCGFRPCAHTVLGKKKGRK